jgi:hypothetical protein
MNVETWTPETIAAEYAFMKSKGWDKLCIAASSAVVKCDLPAHHVGFGLSPAHIRTPDCTNPIRVFQPWEVAGHASRETGLYFWRKYPDGKVPGDNERAWGLLQINLNWQPNMPNLKDPAVNLTQGTLILAEYADQMSVHSGVDTTAAYWPQMIGSAYNAGTRGAILGLTGYQNPDWFCAEGGKKGNPPGDYGQDRLNRSAAYKPLFIADMPALG